MKRSDFDAVGDFHEKFGLENATHAAPNPHEISTELRDFRLKFLLEELAELCHGYGMRLDWVLSTVQIGPAPCSRCGYDGPGFYQPATHPCASGVQDLPKIADALVDLVYVALGTAHLHGLNWAELFAEVQRANITKERANADGSNSARGSSFDVVKPPGWRGPDIIGVLTAAGWPGPPLPLPREEK